MMEGFRQRELCYPYDRSLSPQLHREKLPLKALPDFLLVPDGAGWGGKRCGTLIAKGKCPLF